MTDEEFEKEVQDLADMIRNLRRIRDRRLRKWLLHEIRRQLIEVTRL
jgi:hypothetical protein